MHSEPFFGCSPAIWVLLWLGLPAHFSGVGTWSRGTKLDQIIRNPTSSSTAFMEFLHKVVTTFIRTTARHTYEQCCQEFPIPNMLNMHTYPTSPSNDTPHGHHQLYPGKPPPSSSSHYHIPFPNHYHYDYRTPPVFTTNQPPLSLQH